MPRAETGTPTGNSVTIWPVRAPWVPLRETGCAGQALALVRKLNSTPRNRLPRVAAVRGVPMPSRSTLIDYHAPRLRRRRFSRADLAKQLARFASAGHGTAPIHQHHPDFEQRLAPAVDIALAIAAAGLIMVADPRLDSDIITPLVDALPGPAAQVRRWSWLRGGRGGN